MDFHQTWCDIVEIWFWIANVQILSVHHCPYFRFLDDADSADPDQTIEAFCRVTKFRQK